MSGTDISVNIERHDEIKRRLRAKRITLSNIAREAGCALSMVTMVCQGHRNSRTIEWLIAAKLNERPEALWPDRYRPSLEKGG